MDNWQPCICVCAHVCAHIQIQIAFTKKWKPSVWKWDLIYIGILWCRKGRETGQQCRDKNQTQAYNTNWAEARVPYSNYTGKNHSYKKYYSSFVLSKYWPMHWATLMSRTLTCAPNLSKKSAFWIDMYYSFCHYTYFPFFIRWFSSFHPPILSVTYHPLS